MDMGSESLIDKYNRERALWDKMASEIISRFEEEGLTIKDAKNVLDLVVIMIESSKVSPR
jgi:nucleoside diphosphate kinase